MRPDRVLRVRDRHDARPAGETHGGLDADDAIRVARAHDAAIGFGAERDRREVGCRRRAGSRARAARIAIDAIRVVRLPADGRPSARRVERAEVRPLRQIRLAQDHGAAGAQLGGHGRIARRRRARRARTSRQWSACDRRCRCCP